MTLWLVRLTGWVRLSDSGVSMPTNRGVEVEADAREGAVNAAIAILAMDNPEFTPHRDPVLEVTEIKGPGQWT